jgi:PadR family transcriptional regulator PadR
MKLSALRVKAASSVCLVCYLDFFTVSFRNRGKLPFFPVLQFNSEFTCCFPKGSLASFLLETQMANKQKTEVLQGTLALMVLKTLDVLGALHGYGIARRIEQISGDLLSVNQGTLYPVLLKLEQEGAIESEWGASENNRRARFYRLTKEGRKQLQAETQDWEQTAAIIGRFFEAKAEDLS